MGDELKSAQQLKLKIYNLVCVHTFVCMYFWEYMGEKWIEGQIFASFTHNRYTRLFDVHLCLHNHYVNL